MGKENDLIWRGDALAKDIGAGYVRVEAIADLIPAAALAVPEVKALVEAASPLMSMAMWTETAEDTEMVIMSVGTVRRIRAALRAVEGQPSPGASITTGITSRDPA